MAARITSIRNERVARVRRLVRDAAIRREDGACVIEGLRASREYLAGAGPVSLALVSPRLSSLDGGVALQARLSSMLADRTSDLLEVTDEVFASLSDTPSPQGIMLVVPAPRQEGLPIADGRPLLVAWQVQDPGNLGSLVRTAEGSGCCALLAARAPGGAVADPFSPRALRGAAGSAFRIPVIEWQGAPAALARALADEGFRRVACQAHGGLAPEDADLRGSVAILVGSEAHGLPAELTAPPCEALTIPLAGAAESLNASAAAAVVAFEAARQRRA